MRRRPLEVLTAACLLALGSTQPLTAGEDAEVEASNETADTSAFVCNRCPFPYGWTGSVLFGLEYVSDDGGDFGSFGGWEEEGFYLGLGADLIYRDQAGRYVDIYADRLGLDSRALAISGGQQGTYRLSLDYREIARVRFFDVQSVYDGAGTDRQSLPAGWVREVSTDQMPALQDNLRSYDIGTQRETLGLGFEFKRPSPWNYRLDVEHARRQGTRVQGAAFIFHAAELIAPVDYETTRVDAAVGYTRGSWELETAYNLSTFNNRNDSIRWDNPFVGISISDDHGEMAQPPDNQYHQFMLSGSWRHSHRLSVVGQVAMGRAEQDQDFLAPTINPAFAGLSELPRTDLNGRVDTRFANLRVTGNLTPRLNTRVQFRYDERDNRTPVDSFLEINTDTYPGQPRTNQPYSYDRWTLNANVNYRLSRAWRIGATAERREMSRTLQEVHDTRTDLYSFQVRARPFTRLNVIARYTHEERSNDLDPALLGPMETPSLRRFHFAEKKREAWRLSADYAITEILAAGVYYEWSDDDFSDTEIGLSEGQDESYGLDLSLGLGEHAVAHAWVARESLDATIRGSDFNFGEPWQYRQQDEFLTLGFGVNFDRLPGDWEKARVDVTYARAEGELSVERRGAAPDFPDLDTRRITVQASIERRLTEQLGMRLGYIYGRLVEDDFYRDDVAPDTVGALLGLGRGTPNNTVHVGSVMLRYRFR
jgi:MtrB/PioB family decaheme-associated outer membrane protein